MDNSRKNMNSRDTSINRIDRIGVDMGQKLGINNDSLYSKLNAFSAKVVDVLDSTSSTLLVFSHSSILILSNQLSCASDCDKNSGLFGHLFRL